jgi:hypothetical protein
LPPQFVALQMKHETREDDAIRLVDLLSFQGAIGKHPWGPPYAAALWPYQEGVLNRLFGNLGANWMASIGAGLDVVKWFGRGYPALVTPFMNAHLLDNYLTAPKTATPNALAPADQVIPQDLTDLLKAPASTVAPQGTPVLNILQSDVKALKTALLERGKRERQIAQHGGAGFPMPQGADLGNALGNAVAGFLGH